MDDAQRAEADAYVCGANESGQLAVPPADALLAPLSLSSLSAGVRVAQVALGFCHSLWRSDEGQVYAAGDNASGQCGVHQPDVLAAPLRLEALATKTVSWVAAGFSHSAVVTSDGALLTFGSSDYGQCGHGEAGVLDVRRPRLVRASTPSLASASCGATHTLLLDRCGGVWSFGCGLHGELGLGHFESTTSPTSVAALSSVVVVGLAAGERHSLAICVQGRVLAWGCRKHGALGLPPLSPSDSGLALPRPVPGLVGRLAVQVCAGSDWSCALFDGGEVMHWGRGVRPGGAGGAGDSGAACGVAAADGSLGCIPAAECAAAEALRRSPSCEPASLFSEPQASPVLLPLPGRARAIAAGHSHGLVLLEMPAAGLAAGEAGGGGVAPPVASVYAWGAGRHGELGSAGASLDRPAPLPLPAGARPRAVSAGGHGSIVLTGGGAELPAGSPRPYALSAAEAKRLAEAGSWGELTEVAGAVLSSVALVAASFGRAETGGGGGGAGPSPPELAPLSAGFDSAGLEATYVVLMRTYDSAPEVLAALRASIPRLLAQLTSMLSLQAALPAEGTGPVAVALLALLQNPMLSHASEEAHALSLGQLVGALSPDRRAVAVAMLAAAPPEVLGGRVARPCRDLLERLVSRGADVTPAVSLLSLARDANALSPASPGAAPTVPPSEFVSTLVSDNLALERDYVAWSQGTDGFTFCSQPWLLSVSAKGKLLQFEAAIRMHHSQQVALRHSLFGAQPARAPGGPLQQTVLLPRKRPHAGGDRLLSGGAEERGAACGGTSGAANSPADESASPYLILRVRRSHLVEESLGALALATPLELLKPVRVVFEGEPAIDEGGVRKEFFQLLVEALLGGDYGLFEWNEEARCFWFSRDCLVQDSGADFLLVGLAVGLAIHNGLILDLKFPTLLYSRLLGNEAGLRELKQVQPELWRGLSQLLSFEGDVEATFCADFTVATTAYGEPATAELVQGGKDIPVTNANRAEYVAALVDHLLVSGVRTGFDAFRRGFLTLCDGPSLSFLTPGELEELVCGTPHYDFRALEGNTKYDGFCKTDQTVLWFWEVVHSFSVDEKRALLAFATGCDRAPVGGLGKLGFVLQRSGPDSMALPHAHTCFNLLAMPAYGSRGKLRDRLGIAIHNAQGFGLL